MGKWKKGLASVLAGVLLLSTVAVSQNDFGTAKTEKAGKLPVMGWSSWNLYQGDVGEADVNKQAQALVDTGLTDKGYTYVLLDDGALGKERDAEGYLQPNNKFPSGFEALGEDLHKKGLKFGMQNTAGTATGSGLPGSYNYEARDAQTYADWGVDLLKYVFCNNPLVKKPLEPIPGEADGQSFTQEINGMEPEAPAVNRIVIKEVKDGVSTYVKTVHVSSDNTAMSDGASLDQVTEYMTGLDAKEDLSMEGMGILTFDMEKVDPSAKYTVDVYCFNSDKPRWLSVQVNPQVENRYNKFYLQSDITGDQADTDAESRSIYDVPLIQGENKISFYLSKDAVKKAYQQDVIRSFAAMDKAIEATGREMLLSICDWGWSQPNEWGKYVGYYWRTTADTTRIKNQVEWSGNNQSVLGVYEKNVILDENAGPYGYNDPDALTVGLPGLSEEQNRSHFSLWCMMAAPLFLSADLTTATDDVLNIVGNEEIIALDQDGLCLQASRFKQSEDQMVDYLIKPLEDGSIALCIFNKSEAETKANISIKEAAEAASKKVVAKGSEHLTKEQIKLFTDVFVNTESYSFKDLWNEETGEVKLGGDISVTVPASGVKVFKLAPAVEQEISVVVTPEQETVERGAQVKFNATVTGAKDRTVEWEIEGINPEDETVTRIDEDGMLTIAADEELKEITVKATSNEDRTKTAKAVVKVIDAKKPSVVNVEPLNPIIVDEGIAFKDLKLPTEVTVNTIENGKTGTAAIEVIWNEPAEPLTAGKYEIVGALQIGEKFYNPEQISASVDLIVREIPTPHTLTVKFNTDSAELYIEGQDTDEANQSGVYTEIIMGWENVSLQFTPKGDREFTKAFLDGETAGVKDAKSFYHDFGMPNLETNMFVSFRCVDKSALYEASSVAKELQTSDEYGNLEENQKDEFEKALDEVWEIIDKIDTNQKEVDDACLNLFNKMGDMKLDGRFLLEGLLTILTKLPTDAYSEESGDNLERTIIEAQDLLKKENDISGECLTAYRGLCTCFSDRKYKADLNELTKLLEKAQEINDRLKDYQEAGKEQFLEAFTNALAMDVFNTQEEVDTARENLDQAMEALEEKSAGARLTKLIQQAKSLNLSKYDYASRTRLSKALDEANKALASGNEEELEQACRNLEEALAKMQNKKPDRPKKNTSLNPMTYGEGTARADVPALIAAQAVQATVSVRSDTTMPFVLKRGKAYCFKMTVLDGRTEIPSFTVGNNSVLKTQFVAQVGSDCYFRVWAVGKPGQGTGVYTAMPGEFPQLKCLVTVG